jgi:ATP-dependent DNA ligase
MDKIKSSLLTRCSGVSCFYMAIVPMEARLVDVLPVGENWQYEPKWDGFRCLVYRKGSNIDLQSKAGKPLQFYFPELVKAIGELSPSEFILDGEIVVPVDDGLDFNQLLQRIHPAISRVKKLAAEYPAHLMVFDVLSDEKGRSLLDLPLAQRRQHLEVFARKHFSKGSLLHLSPATADLSQARAWMEGRGSFLDGVIAKRLDLPYAAGQRTAMEKFKRIHTADCVVGGFRYGGNSKTAVGSLLLGLYDKDGLLHHVGFTSGIAKEERSKLLKVLTPLIQEPGFTGNRPGGPSRWSTERSEEWQPLKPKLVVEVSFDHVTQGRFRHGTKIIRWRPDRAPAQCTMEQIASPLRKRPLFDLIA